MYKLPQKLAAEFLGTFAVVLAACGSICANQYLHAGGAPGFGVLGEALAEGLAYALLFAALSHVSGAHFNPSISIGLWVTKRLSTFETIFYCLAQLLGALAAAYFLAAVLPESDWRPVGLGVTNLATDFTRLHGMMLEALLTFFLVFIFFAASIDQRSAASRAGGFAVGLTVTLGVLIGGPFTGASMNPARTFGPALAANQWTNHGVYWAGPLFGGILAGVLYERLFLRDQPSA
ncbi:MAG TPA: aquaporin [Candidatus Acidoferrum sp.]|nr:aquaporin [Candidatus Acidoferrum sp.]